MGSTVLFLALLVGGFVVAQRLGLIGSSAKGSKSADAWPLYAKRVLTPAEQKCYFRLRSAFPDHILLAQVSLSQLLGVQKGRGANYQAVFNRFRQLTADFVLCDKSFAVVAVFELDDRSHDSPKRQNSDSRKSAALAAAGLALHRLNCSQLPTESDLVRLVSSAGQPGIAA